jgi:hypothetical protein
MPVAAILKFSKQISRKGAKLAKKIHLSRRLFSFPDSRIRLNQ